MQVSTIGLDIAKNVFQVHGEDAEGRIVFQRKLGRNRMVDFFAKIAPCVGKPVQQRGGHFGITETFMMPSSLTVSCVAGKRAAEGFGRL
jgi:transposase